MSVFSVTGSLKPSNGSSSHGQSLASLVDAVVQLGGASEAQQSLRKHLATQVRAPLGAGIMHATLRACVTALGR